jgi:hypothetical protein
MPRILTMGHVTEHPFRGDVDRRSNIHLLGGADARTPDDDTGKEVKMPPLPPQQCHAVLDTLPEHFAAAAERDLHQAINRLCEFADLAPAPRRRRRLVAFSGVVTLWAEAAIIVVAQSVGLS